MIGTVALLFGSAIGFNIYKSYMIKKFISQRTVTYPVTTEKLKEKNWAPFIHAIGFIKPSKGLELSNEQAGVIAKINFLSGQEVKQGNILVELDTAVEVANLKVAESRLLSVKSHFERTQKLYKEKSISKQSLENSQASYNALLGEIAGLKATIKRRLVIAPFNGKVGIKDIYIGQYLAAGTKVVRVENTKVMNLQFTVTQSDLAQVRTGFSVSVFVDAYPHQPFYGTIVTIEPAVNKYSGVVDVLAAIPNHRNELISGMYAKVIIHLLVQKNQLLIPLRAVNFQLYETSVYVVNEIDFKTGKGSYKTAKQVSIITDGQTRNEVRVVSGLKKGDEIIVSGQAKLSNNDRIKIVDSKALTKPATIPQL